jgi:hypothetical protein
LLLGCFVEVGGAGVFFLGSFVAAEMLLFGTLLVLVRIFGVGFGLSFLAGVALGAGLMGRLRYRLHA